MDYQAQLEELNSALSDLVEGSSTGEISATLAEMLDLMKSRKDSGVTVTNQVHPAPVTVVQSDTQIDYFTHEYDTKGRIVKSIPHRSPRKGA